MSIPTASADWDWLGTSAWRECPDPSRVCPHFATLQAKLRRVAFGVLSWAGEATSCTRAADQDFAGAPRSPLPSCQAKLNWVQNRAALNHPPGRYRGLLRPPTGSFRIRNVRSTLLPAQVRLGAPPEKCRQELLLILRLTAAP